MERRQNREESIDSYAYDILSRCHKLGKAPRETIVAFIRGLLPEIKGQVAVMQPQMMEEAERIARTALTYATPTPAPATVAAVHQTESPSLDTFTTTLQQLIAEIYRRRLPPPEVNINRMATDALTHRDRHDKRRSNIADQDEAMDELTNGTARRIVLAIFVGSWATLLGYV